MKMKNKIRILIAMFALIAFTACEDLIIDKPESKLTQVDFFNTKVRINAGVMGCYAGMANIMNSEWKFTENRSDNSCVASTGTGSGERVDLCDIKFFRTSPSEPLLYSYWYVYFQNIMNINAILPAVASGQTIVPIESDRAQYEGELLFMRGFHYFQLVTLWGDMFKVTSVIVKPEDAKTYTRRPVVEIYNDIIIPDLIKAANQLPSSYSTNDIGRVTKWAAKGMLAKVYMTLGGDANLALAKGLLEEVMAAPGLGLLTDKGTSTSAYANIFNTANEMNKEIIFAIRYKGGTSGVGSPFWSTFAPDGSANLFLKVGTPVGNNNPTPEIMAFFNKNLTDTRIDATFRTWLKGTTIVPYVSKFIDSSISQDKQGENDWIVIRYADIQLLHAEVLAQGANPDDARADVNAIRTRAGITTYSTAFGSKTEALDAVYNERRLELAFEDQRWFDLLRMNTSYGDSEKAITILKTAIFTTDWTALYSKFYPIIPPTANFFNSFRLLLPIPQQEIDTNNDMVITQNPNY
jgi:hypothetical protein